MDEMVLPANLKQDTFNHKNLTLSASSIKSYERCPLQFKFNKIMHIPSIQTPRWILDPSFTE